jgi:hypothetical protein
MVKRLVLAALLAAACGPKDEPSVLRNDHCPVGGCVVDAGAGGTGGAPIEIPPEPLEDWDTTGAGPLSGIFAVQAEITANVVLPVETRQLFRLRLVQHGTTIRAKSTLCAFKLPVVEGVATLIIPPKLEQLLWTKGVETNGEYLSKPETLGASYTPPPSLVLVGANLTNPATDDLPTLENPATSIDEDDDGNLGVTLEASLLTCETFQELYVALRTVATLSGTVLTPDVIEGTADVSLDQKVLGYSDPCLASAETINITIDPGSPFRAQRVGDAEDVDQNGNVSCPELKQNAVALFGDFWAN